MKANAQLEQCLSDKSLVELQCDSLSAQLETAGQAMEQQASEADQQLEMEQVTTTLWVQQQQQEHSVALAALTSEKDKLQQQCATLLRKLQDMENEPEMAEQNQLAALKQSELEAADLVAAALDDERQAVDVVVDTAQQVTAAVTKARSDLVAELNACQDERAELQSENTMLQEQYDLFTEQVEGEQLATTLWAQQQQQTHSDALAVLANEKDEIQRYCDALLRQVQDLTIEVDKACLVKLELQACRERDEELEMCKDDCKQLQLQCDSHLEVLEKANQLQLQAQQELLACQSELEACSQQLQIYSYDL